MIVLDHRKLLAKDPAATAAFLSYLQRYIRRFLPDPSRAREVAQSALAEVLAKLERGADPEPEHIHRWTANCASNAIRRELTRQRHRAVEFESRLHTQAEPVDLLAVVQARRDIERIDKLLEHFKPRARQTLVAAARGDTNEEMAEELGVSPGAARKTLFRARKKLEHDLTAQERREQMSNEAKRKQHARQSLFVDKERSESSRGL